MARMFPESPDWINVRSPAEKLLYHAFKEKLPDEIIVFHSVKWQVKNVRSGAKDGEADFLLAIPHLGLLVLEVKGGNISRQESKWLSNNHWISDPFQQARNNKYSLLSLLKQYSYWRQRWVTIGHAVAFPDVSVAGSLGLDAPLEIILDRVQLNNLFHWVQSAMRYWCAQEKLTAKLDNKGIEELKRILNRSIYLPIRKSNEIERQNEELVRLSQQQFKILDFLGQHRRVAISGCAGSGKTILAIEKARRLHHQNFNVLLTCYNRGLAGFLRQSLGRRKNLYTFTFHALCEKLAREAGLDLTLKSNTFKHHQHKNILFEEIYPEVLINAADKLNWRVDAVIVDEGQDFTELWWTALKCLLTDPDNGIFYFFYDDNQNIFNKGWHPPLEEAPFPLTENWRNTQKIHAYVHQFYQGQNAITAIGLGGREVEIVNYTKPDLLKKLSRVLHRLVIDEKIAAQDIVILTTKKMPALENKYVGQFLVKAQPAPQSQQIECHTVYYFKGLERPVVILIENDLNQVTNLNKLLYVGTSRARSHLIVFHPDT